MRRWLRRIAIVVVLAVVVVAGIQFARNQDEQAGNQSEQNLVQEATTVQVNDLSVTVSATGPVLPARQVALAFELSAPVSEVLVSEGQKVRAGDVLARLDTADLETALVNAQIGLETQQAAYNALVAPPRDVDIAVAEAALNAARAAAGAVSLGADENEVEIARLQAELARNQLWQAQLQRDQSALVIPPQQRELAAAQGINLPPDENPADNVTAPIMQAENSVQLSDVNLSGVQNQGADVAGLSSANAQIVAAQTQLDRLLNGPSDMELQIAETQLQIAERALEQAEANLQRAVLVAPFDGVITQNHLVVGETPPQGAAMQLIDTTGFLVDVGVDETDIVDVQVGQKVEVALDALPGATITGTVTRVALAPLRVGQLVTYTVRVALDPSDEPVRAGMTATTTIIVNELANVPTLPNRFIRIDRATQQAYVTVERTGGFEEVPVELGLRNETDSQIISGVDVGQRVVLLPRGTWNPIEQS